MILAPIIDAPGYFAGEDGEIYSKNGRWDKSLKKLKKNTQTSGRYYYVNIKIFGKFVSKRVHKLVCAAFHGNPPEENYTVSHIDGDWKNNSPRNLKCESHSDNTNRKKLHGTDDIGVKNSRAKINLDQLIKIRELLKNGVTHQKIADSIGVSRTFITKVANGYRYKNQGINS